MRDYAELEAVLGHTFRDRELLVTALRHSSWCNEQPAPRPDDNQRLEFLGDSVLSLTVSHRLMDRFPDGSERDLSVSRQQIVSEAALTAVARPLGIGAWLFLGKGEQKSGGADKPRILADAFEAILGAIFLDGGFAAADHAIEHLLAPTIASAELKNFYDFKTRLQVTAQARALPAPTYKVLEAIGPDHEKHFVVAAMIGDEEWGRGVGHPRQQAEQFAAAEANFRLEGSDIGVKKK